MYEKVIAIVGEEEWYGTLEKEDGGITMVLSLFGDQRNQMKF